MCNSVISKIVIFKSKGIKAIIHLMYFRLYYVLAIQHKSR